MTESVTRTATSDGAPVAADDACRACGLAPSPAWDTADGRIHLCPPCATMHGIGCG